VATLRYGVVLTTGAYVCVGGASLPGDRVFNVLRGVRLVVQARHVVSRLLTSFPPDHCDYRTLLIGSVWTGQADWSPYVPKDVIVLDGCHQEARCAVGGI
jgi:hypothetical protein